jgi:hypothetical protein
MAELVKCMRCGAEGEYTRTCCRKCGAYIPPTGAEAEAKQSDPPIDYLRDINASLRTIKRIAIWWLILSILGVLAGLLWFAMTH